MYIIQFENHKTMVGMYEWYNKINSILKAKHHLYIINMCEIFFLKLKIMNDELNKIGKNSNKNACKNACNFVTRILIKCSLYVVVR